MRTALYLRVAAGPRSVVLVSAGVGMTVVPLRPKESKLERFARLEALRLATRPEPHWCNRCGFRPTSRPSGNCRPCDLREERRAVASGRAPAEGR